MTTTKRKRGRTPGKLDDRELTFVRLLLEGVNQTEAARRAGWTGTAASLGTRGCALAKSPKIVAELARRREILDAKSTMTREARLAMAEAFAQDPKLDARARLKALELRAKMGGDFVERRQIETAVTMTGPVRVEVTLAPDRARELARKGLTHGTATQPHDDREHEPAAAPAGDGTTSAGDAGHGPPRAA